MSELISKYLPNVANLGWTGDSGWGTALFQTIFMTFWPAVIGGLLGLIFGLALVLTKDGGILANRAWFNLYDKIVSFFRAIPFIILLAFIAPFIRPIMNRGHYRC